MDINTVKNDVLAMQKKVRGKRDFFSPKFLIKIKKSNQQNVEVIFDIKEFEKVRVKKIYFLGNKAFRDRGTEKSYGNPGRGFLFSFMTGSGNFKEFNFQTDVERIKYFYKTKGYLQVNLGSASGYSVRK